MEKANLSKELLILTTKYPELHAAIEKYQGSDLNIINTIKIDDASLLIYSITYFRGNRNKNFINFLLRNGADTNIIPQSHHWLALHQALVYDDIKLIKLLLDYDANINIKNNFGVSTLDVCCFERKEFEKKVSVITLLNLKN